jgi:hypothetical protein
MDRRLNMQALNSRCTKSGARETVRRSSHLMATRLSRTAEELDATADQISPTASRPARIQITWITGTAVRSIAMVKTNKRTVVEDKRLPIAILAAHFPRTNSAFPEGSKM